MSHPYPYEIGKTYLFVKLEVDIKINYQNYIISIPIDNNNFKVKTDTGLDVYKIIIDDIQSIKNVFFIELTCIEISMLDNHYIFKNNENKIFSMHHGPCRDWITDVVSQNNEENFTMNGTNIDEKSINDKYILLNSLVNKFNTKIIIKPNEKNIQIKEEPTDKLRNCFITLLSSIPDNWKISFVNQDVEIEKIN